MKYDAGGVESVQTLSVLPAPSLNPCEGPRGRSHSDSEGKKTSSFLLYHSVDPTDSQTNSELGHSVLI